LLVFPVEMAATVLTRSGFADIQLVPIPAAAISKQIANARGGGLCN
jgi:hypothetical protein